MSGGHAIHPLFWFIQSLGEWRQPSSYQNILGTNHPISHRSKIAVRSHTIFGHEVQNLLTFFCQNGSFYKWLRTPPHPLIYHLQMICCSEHNCRQENEGTHRQPRKWPEMEKHWKTPENPAFAWLEVGSVGDTVWQCDTVVGSVGDSQGLPGIAERTNGVISGLITGRRISCHPQKYWNTKNWSHKILAKENARTQ